MAELVRTNDHGVIAVVEGLLDGSNIPYYVADRDISSIAGTINAIQARIMVPDDYEERAREALTDADVGDWLL